jgi:cystathionine beta-lyase/cystathionine gamma-synthase
MADPAILKAKLEEVGVASVIYADSPRNWFLDVLDIEAISQLAHGHGAKLVVDTSLQPLQNARAKGADVEVISLSKYPSNGMAMGGACVSDNADLMKEINLRVASDGHMLAQPAAQIILHQSQSLNDRLHDVSGKAGKVTAFLRDHPDVLSVNCPDPQKLDGLSGGQITFLLRDASQGNLFEAIVGNNALSGFPLHLAGTFGAAITTIEHFASNPRHREGIPKEATNEILIPDNMVRLGIGLEDVDEIIDALNFVLNMSSALQPTPGVPRREQPVDVLAAA